MRKDKTKRIVSMQKVAVPTATVIIAKSNDPGKIIAFRPSKHGCRLTLPGGRCDFDRETPFQCAEREAREEVGVRLLGPPAGPPRLFHISAKPRRDVRIVSAEKLGGDSGRDPSLDGFKFEAHYGYGDFVFLAHTHEEPRPDHVESKEVFWFDVSGSIVDGEWALDFAEYVKLYRNYLETGVAPLRNIVVL